MKEKTETLFQKTAISYLNKKVDVGTVLRQEFADVPVGGIDLKLNFNHWKNTQLQNFPAVESN